MTIRTRAAVVSRPGGPFVFQDVELDGPRPGEALVRMVACGICHTDIAARDGLFGLDFPAYSDMKARGSWKVSAEKSFGCAPATKL